MRIRPGMSKPQQTNKFESAFQSARSAIDGWAEDSDGGVANPDYSRIEFNHVAVEFEEVDDPEAKAVEYYAGLGYNVFPMLKQYQEHIDDFPFLKNQGITATERGIPDLFVFRVFQEVNIDPCSGLNTTDIMRNWKFVEVKSESDGLRTSQMEWMSQHPDMPVDVIVVEESK